MPKIKSYKKGQTVWVKLTGGKFAGRITQKHVEGTRKRSSLVNVNVINRQGYALKSQIIVPKKAITLRKKKNVRNTRPTPFRAVKQRFKGTEGIMAREW